MILLIFGKKIPAPKNVKQSHVHSPSHLVWHVRTVPCKN